MTVIYNKRANLAAPRQISLTIFRNPTGSDLEGYRTQIDPATIASKLNPGTDPTMIQIATPNDQIIQAKWQESYGTNIDDCKVWTKISPGANAPAPIIVYDTPGAEDNSDDEHQVHITDVSGDDGIMMYMLFAGATTPTGYTLASGTSGEFENRYIVGADGELNIESGIDNIPVSLISCGGSSSCPWNFTSGSNSCYCNHTHGLLYTTGKAIDKEPPYYELKVLRSDGISAKIPKDAVIIFDDTVPTGFTRLSGADGYYIRGGGTPGGTGGNATWKVRVNGWLDAATQNAEKTGTGYLIARLELHYHKIVDKDSAAMNNDPPYINAILGKADEEIEYIPEGAIMMFTDTPNATDWEVITAFNKKLIKGAASYGGTGGNATKTPANISFTSGITATDTYTTGLACGSGADGAQLTHTHEVEISLGTVNNYPLCKPVIFAKAKHDISTDGENALTVVGGINLSATGWNAATAIAYQSQRHIILRNKGTSVGEIHCCFWGNIGGGYDSAHHGKSTDGGKTWTIERIDDSWNGSQTMPAMAIDDENNIHFVWTEYDAADTAHLQVKYRKLSSSDVWGSVETVSTAGDPYRQFTTAIQIKTDGTVGVVWAGKGWGTDTDSYDLAYRERTGEGWQSEVAITSNATSSNYFVYPTLDYDTDDYPHIAATKMNEDGTTLDVCYWYKTAAGWKSMETVNNDTGDSGNGGYVAGILVDENNRIHVAYNVTESEFSSRPQDVVYKSKPRGGSWPVKETIGTHTATKDYNLGTQIQLLEDGKLIATVVEKNYNGTQWVTTMKFAIRSESWSSLEPIAESGALSYIFAEIPHARRPIKGGIQQTAGKQGACALCVGMSAGDWLHSAATIFIKNIEDSVYGKIDDTIEKETYRTKRRGAICKSKVNGPKASPACIS